MTNDTYCLDCEESHTENIDALIARELRDLIAETGELESFDDVKNTNDATINHLTQERYETFQAKLGKSVCGHCGSITFSTINRHYCSDCDDYDGGDTRNAIAPTHFSIR